MRFLVYNFDSTRGNHKKRESLGISCYQLVTFHCSEIQITEIERETLCGYRLKSFLFFEIQVLRLFEFNCVKSFY